jgi:uncharacterized membrane protein YesL
MAGFFGLFNYEKEGPGIHKNAPKKKTFVVFFETFFRNFWKFITINLVYALLSIPVITNGLAHAGLTNVTRNTARDKHSFGLSDFFDTIKKNWKQALGAGIINTIVVILLGFDFYFFVNSEGMMATIGLGICACMTFIFSVMCFYIWTLMITFKFTLKQIYKNSFKFVFLNMKYNLLCGFILVLVNGLFIGIAILTNLNMLVVTIELMIYLCVYPAFSHLLVQFCTFPSIKKFIIDPYYKEHPDEDIDKRKDLGIDIEDDSEEEGEDADGEDDESGAVFSDERIIPENNNDQ